MLVQVEIVRPVEMDLGHLDVFDPVHLPAANGTVVRCEPNRIQRAPLVVDVAAEFGCRQTGAAPGIPNGQRVHYNLEFSIGTCGFSR